MNDDTRPDWPAIRLAYEAGGISHRALAREHGISLKAIQKRAQSENWKRPDVAHDRGGGISKAMAVAGKPLPNPMRTAEIVHQPMTKRQQTPSDRSVSHKEVIDRGRALVSRLLDELNAITSHIGEIKQMIVDETANDRDGRRRYVMQQAINLSTRAGVMRNLALAAKTLAEAAPGKREEQAEAAQKAGTEGRFAVPAGPRLVRQRSDDG